jgi:hypothetical protein
MDFGHLDDTLPTIPCKTSPPKRKKSPPKTLNNAIATRIQAQEGLCLELDCLWGKEKKAYESFMDRLVGIVAKGLFDMEEMRAAIREKQLAEASSKKALARWKGRPLNQLSSKRLSRLSKTAHRKLMANEALIMARSGRPARHCRNVFRRTVIELYDFFSPLTPQPYRYMASIAGLFHLHQKLCSGCPHLPKARKPIYQRRVQSLSTTIRRGTGLCKLENILDCPRRQTGRQTLAEII